MTINTITDDPRVVFERAMSVATDVVGAIRIDQLAEPTPCPEFDVRQMLGHLVGVLGRVSALGRGEDIFAVSLDVDVADDGWPEAVADAVAEVRAIWADDAVLARPVVLPWTQGTGATALFSWTNEVVVHTWDLAIATGQHPSWDDEVVRVAFDAIRTSLPSPEGRKAMYEEMMKDIPADARPRQPFADAIPIDHDAPLIDQLIAWNGRRP